MKPFLFTVAFLLIAGTLAYWNPPSGLRWLIFPPLIAMILVAPFMSGGNRD